VRLVRSVRSDGLTTVGIGWMITTVRRIHIDSLRSSERERRRLRAASAGSSQPTSTGSREIPSMLDGLADREPSALILRYVDDLSVDDLGAADVADLMGDSVHATESSDAHRRTTRRQDTSPVRIARASAFVADRCCCYLRRVADRRLVRVRRRRPDTHTVDGSRVDDPHSGHGAIHRHRTTHRHRTGELDRRRRFPSRHHRSA